VKVSEVIHLFEAWLATLAILIFHFFYVIAHPEVYPISLAMFHGRMPEEHAKHHHPRWSEEGMGPANPPDPDPESLTQGNGSGDDETLKPVEDQTA
jgi:cytochrome b subunit of formate dehydrogenase